MSRLDKGRHKGTTSTLPLALRLSRLVICLDYCKDKRNKIFFKFPQTLSSLIA